jgi:hypothetical protein
MSKLGLGRLGAASEAIKALQENDKVLVDVPLHLIDFDTDQYRKDKERYNLVKLATSIRDNGGLIQNPNYEKQKNGRYLVLTGEMRTRSYMYLRDTFPNEPQWKSIPARIKTVKIIDGLSLKASRKIYQFAENDLGEKPNLFERAQGLIEIFEEGGKEAIIIALSEKELKSSDGEVSKWRSISKVNLDIRSDILDNNIEDKETVITLGKIADSKPEVYKDLIERFINKSLGKSLLAGAKESWDQIKKNGGKKPSRAKGKVKKIIPSKIQNKKNDIEISEMIASDVEFKDGSLVVITKNGIQMKFVGLEHLKIKIEKVLANSKRGNHE